MSFDHSSNPGTIASKSSLLPILWAYEQMRSMIPSVSEQYKKVRPIPFSSRSHSKHPFKSSLSTYDTVRLLGIPFKVSEVQVINIYNIYDNHIIITI